MAGRMLNMFLSIPAILIAFTFREYIRARVAYNLGDKSQKLEGKMTLDPFAHIDLIGFIAIIFTGFGWTKGTTVNKYAFKHPKEDSIKVTLAALFSHILIAFIGALFMMLFVILNLLDSNEVLQILTLIFQYVIIINVSLFVFNLIPIPGLEMYNLLVDIAPKKAYEIAKFTSQYYIVILLVIIFFAGRIMSYPATVISGLIMKLANIIFTIILNLI
ncbi:site-2 protease family protein [Clostridium mediterraneense]|uniref:site-2 protease family protein n=1 Tax=Clostridium mediterraneense TaxID=1805472 RepID=UPI000A004C08|nr:site-2 protease family protein [Clostridium mediterraneense]